MGQRGKFINMTVIFSYFQQKLTLTGEFTANSSALQAGNSDAYVCQATKATIHDQTRLLDHRVHSCTSTFLFATSASFDLPLARQIALLRFWLDIS